MLISSAQLGVQEKSSSNILSSTSFLRSATVAVVRSMSLSTRFRWTRYSKDLITRTVRMTEVAGRATFVWTSEKSAGILTIVYGASVGMLTSAEAEGWGNRIEGRRKGR